MFVARGASMRRADGEGNVQLMVVLVRVLVVVVMAAASYPFARLHSNHRFV